MEKYNLKEGWKATTFAEFVEYGIRHGGNVVGEMPWSFVFEGHTVTHENDDCYLVSPDGSVRFNRGDILLTGPENKIYPVQRDIFYYFFGSPDAAAKESEPIVTVHISPNCSPETLQALAEMAKALLKAIDEGWKPK